MAQLHNISTTIMIKTSQQVLIFEINMAKPWECGSEFLLPDDLRDSFTIDQLQKKAELIFSSS